jgi:uncharacterized membrane protein YheB (UPF0754 family)
MPPELENDDQNVPSPDEEVNFQLSDEDVETIVNIDENGNASAQIAQSGSENEGKEHEEYGQKVKKRLDKLTAKLREAERREQAAIAYAQNVQKSLQETQTRAAALDKGFLTETEGRIQSQLSIVEANLQDAVERGDGKAVVEAQKLLNQLTIQQERVKVAKTQRVNTPVYQPAPQPVVQQQAPARVDPRAEEWAEENEWFGADEVMTAAAFTIHNKLSEEGFDLQSDEYYDELNRRIRREFPHKFARPQANTSNVPSVAPATRGTSVNGGRRSVKLTPSEVSIARRIGVPLDEYAKYVRR